MDDNDQKKSPELGPESDEVEILEVVGFVDDGEGSTTLDDSGGGRGEPAGDEADADEYVLDFDESGHDLLAREAVPAEDGSAEQRLLRLRADYDNLRKRIDRERQEFEFYANFALVGRLLPFIDNLERALAVESDAQGEGLLREGLAMMHRELIEQLRREGLQEIRSVGRRFDPNLHDAVATAPESNEPPNTIVEELQKGYLFQDRVLRPAMVRVSTCANGGEAEDGNDESHES